MPLPPKVRQARRAQATRLKDPVKIGRRKRCQNCNALFSPTRPNRRFCREECRKEYHHHGSAFGPMRDKLEKIMREMMAKLERRFDLLDERVTDLRFDVNNLTPRDH